MKLNLFSSIFVTFYPCTYYTINTMKAITALFLLIFSLPVLSQEKKYGYIIPSREVNYKSILKTGKNKMDSSVVAPDLYISRQVTLGEYKQYLETVKKDSSETFYKSQLPDTSMCTKSAYEKYISDKQYESFPVAGVTWENAMNYCRWKTIKENRSDTVTYFYRLPTLGEWLNAVNYANDKISGHDFGTYFSDWTMTSRDETPDDWFEYGDQKWHEVKYIAAKKDSPAMKRKTVMGNSFKNGFTNYVINRMIYFYQYEGLSHVSFRLVKIDCREFVTIKKTIYSAQWIAEDFWNLKIKTK
ncbi:MAG: SUMF1/EgtB/PvdO family nonheme iron enzyme [Bacteroidota bacterium]